MHRSVFLPLFSVLAGCVGALLRRYEIAHAFEPDTGLAIAGYPASTALLCLSAAVLVIAAVFLRGGAVPSGPIPYQTAFYAPEAGYAAAICFSSLILFASAAAGFGQYFSGAEARISRLILFFFTAVSGLCVLLTGLRTYRKKDPEQINALLLVPAFFACLWLVLVYQSNAADPVLLSYIYELLAVVCAVLGLYSIAGFGFGRGRVRRTAYYCLMGVYFSMVTIADGHSLPFLLLHLFSAVYLLLSAAVLLRNSEQTKAA